RCIRGTSGIGGNNGLGEKTSSGPSGERGRARRGNIGMKSSSSSLSLSPGITLGPRELEDPAREVLFIRSIPLAPARGAIGMKSSSSSLSPAITLEPRELDD